MKKTVLLGIMLIIASLTVSAQRTFAVIAGVSNYVGSSNDLNQSTKDAKNIAMLYKKKGAIVNLYTSKYATRSKVLAAIEKISKASTDEDHIVFYYSGHGAPNTVCTYTEPGESMMTYDELFAALDKCKAKDIVCYIDACHAGTAVSALNNGERKAGEQWKNIIKASPRYILMLSSRGEEYSMESPLVGAGYFTRALLKGLRGKSDSNADRNITVIELFKYVYGDVMLHSEKQQHPQLVTSSALHNNILMSW